MMGRLIRKWKRRQPGIYAYRTWQHKSPTRAEWGYVGKSNRLDLRDGQHADKPWYDQVIRRYVVIRLPWWLGWDWILLPLETLVILLFLPRYNWQKNPRPGKVGPIEQKRQRQEREMMPAPYRRKVETTRWVDRTIQVAGALLVVTGAIGWMVTK